VRNALGIVLFGPEIYCGGGALQPIVHFNPRLRPEL
jgi:hypothetical protein